VTRESWSGAAAYEAFVGRLSRRVAPRFVEWLSVRPDRRWLDVGCGTGALTRAILDEARPAAVTGVEPSAPFLAAARETIRDPRATFLEGPATALPVPDASADAAVAGLVLNFVGDTAAALAEFRRVLVPGGTVGAYVWDYAERMELIRLFFDAAIAVDAPGAAEADEGPRFPLCRPGPLGDAFRAAGFRNVAVEPIEVSADYADFDAFWTPFLGGVGAAPTYHATLDEPTQVRIRERLRSTVPREPDGSIRLAARAWAVRGVN
jgi:SAM-dependent methyltransferase